MKLGGSMCTNVKMMKNKGCNDTELVTGHMSDEPDNELCPVTMFVKYASKLNPNCNRLWQYPKESFTENDDVWYQNRPIGRDTLAKFMSCLSQKVPLSTIYTYHCIRVTGTSILSKSNFPQPKLRL